MTWCFKATLQLPKANLPFVEKWPLAEPNEMVFILATYFAFIFKIGPYIMEKRSPLPIKPLIIAYDLLQVINSAALTYRFFVYILDKGLFPKGCEYDQVTTYTVATLYWKYMITKVLDLFDTIFFVLRKKWQQVTFLHVYHHIFVLIITWTSLKYDPSDHWAFMALTNCFIHTVMYTYYGMAAMGPTCARYLWWKKYLTVMQLIQFVVVPIHIVIQSYNTECPIHSATYWVGLSNLLLLLVLFVDFYKKRYRNVGSKDIVQFACNHTE